MTEEEISISEEEVVSQIDLLEERAEEITALIADRAFATLESRIGHFQKKAELLNATLDTHKAVLGERYLPLYTRAVQLQAKVAGIALSVKNLAPKPNPDGNPSTSKQNEDDAPNALSENYQAVTLKKFHLPTFNGDLKNYREFIETFTTAVHNKNYHEVDKINFLFDVLRGPAKDAVRGYDRVAHNYPIVLDILKERFGDESKLVNVYYKELESLPPGHTSASQRANLDAIRKILTNLNALGTNVDQEYLKAIILRKFNRETLIATLTRLVTTPGEKFSVDKAIETLTNVVQIRELADNFLNSDTSTVSKPTAYPGALVGGRKARGGSQARSSIKCAFCSATHRSSECNKYVSLRERRDYIREKGLCFFCLSSGHTPNTCQVKLLPCSHCHQTGHAKHTCIDFLEGGQPSSPKKARHEEPPRDNRPQTSRQWSRNKRDAPKGTFLETFVVFIKTKTNNYLLVRGVMDSCSAYSYTSTDLVDRLGLRVTKPTRLNICLFGTSEPCQINSGEVRLTLSNLEKTVQKTLTFMTTSCITGEMETSPSVDSVAEVLPKNLRYADPDLFSEKRRDIDLIVGNNYQFSIYTGQVKPIYYGIILRQSMLGWIPTGAIKPEQRLVITSVTPTLLGGFALSSKAPKCLNTDEKLPEIISPTPVLLANTNLPIFDPLLDSAVLESDSHVISLDNMWTLENLGIKSSELEGTDEFVLDNFRSTVRFENQRFIVRWPWKQENPHLQSNYRMSLARLKSLIQRSTPHLLAEYDKLLKNQSVQGIIEIAPKTTPFLTHYLPHRAVPQKNKLRVVYDASAKTKSGHSLNDLLHKGPVLLEDLVGLLINFRLNAVALTADIEKAFLQVGLNEVDRDVVRFIWLKDVTLPISPENIIIYRFARVPFGVASSPFLLNMVLQELLSTPPFNAWHTAARNKFYVDNLVMSVENTNDAITAYHAITSKLNSASFNLRDWTSNDPHFLKALGQAPLTETPEIVSVLGLNWDRGPDELTVKLQSNESLLTTVTKRLVLKFYASIYDPLGFFSPCTLPLKILLQKCWKLKYDWDTSLPAELVAQWIKAYNECVNIPTITVPRRYWSFHNQGSVTLHVFCDASKTAYACCAYLVYNCFNTFDAASSLAFAKVKIAPVPSKKEQTLTIPKLELLAVLIGTRTATFLKGRLDIQVTNTYVWTDATTVLQWLNSNRIQPIFIQNRLTEIRKVKDVIVRYVPTDSNPADLASRGCKTDIIKDNQLWWHGPPWLCHEKLWPSSPDMTQPFSSAIPLPPACLTAPYRYNGFLTDELEKRFHHWNAYVRICKYINRMRYRHLGIIPSSLEEFQSAELLLVSELQKKYLHHELTSLKKGEQPNAQLELCLIGGIIRCKGRLENAAFPWDTIHPILLPRNSPLTDLYIRDLHRKNFHIGCTHLLAKLRERFWVTKARSKISSIIHRCVICRRLEGGSYQLPPMPPLPLFRVAEASPFLHTGVDYTGFITIKNEANEPIKVYIVLYVCLVTRAVHLEPARDLSGGEFLLTLIKFGSIRGSPQIIISDNATNFTFVQPLVGHKVSVSDPQVDLYLNTNNIQWKFIPQYAPWHGGAYERLVGIVKRSLKKAYGTSYLDYVQLSTILYQLADTINSRPLTYVSSNEILSALTPNHFLRLRRTNATLPIEVTAKELPSTTENLLTAWSETLCVVDQFWEVFRKHYLLSLREKHTVSHPTVRGSLPFVPAPGDVVLVQEPSAPRLDWRYGVILKVNKRLSLADVRCNGKTISRSINQLYPLELPTTINQTPTQ